MDGVNQSTSPILPGGLQDSSGVQSPDAGVGKLNGVSVTAVDVEATPGLKRSEDDLHTEEKSDPTPLRKRKSRRASRHETVSIRKRLSLDNLKSGASKLKGKLSSKAHSFTEGVTDRANSLKSKVYGNTKRKILHESWKEIPQDVLKKASPELRPKLEKFEEKRVELGLLKDAQHAEAKDVKGFKKEFKAALELLEHPEKFEGKKGAVDIALPGGEVVTIHEINKTSRRERVLEVANQFRETEGYQQFEATVKQGVSERAALKQELKQLSKEISAEHKTEWEVVVGEAKADFENEREIFEQGFDEKVDLQHTSYKKTVESKKQSLSVELQKIVDLEEELETKQLDAASKSQLKSKAKLRAKGLRRAAHRLPDGEDKRELLTKAERLEEKVTNLESKISKSKARLSELPNLIKKQDKATKRAQNELEKTLKGKALEEAEKQAGKRLDGDLQRINGREKEVLSELKTARKAFKGGLGR